VKGVFTDSSLAFRGIFRAPLLATVFFSGLGVSALLTLGFGATLVAGSASSFNGWTLRSDRRRGPSDAVSSTATDFRFGISFIFISLVQQAQMQENSPC
jgi:hypothetical protein